MDKLPTSLLQLILSFGDTRSQLNMQLISRKTKNLNLTIITIGLPNNEIVNKYAHYLQYLIIPPNSKITDETIKKINKSCMTIRYPLWTIIVTSLSMLEDNSCLRYSS